MTTTNSREVIADVPAELEDRYRKSITQVPDLTRQFWRQHPNADPRDLEPWLHEQRLDLAREAKAAEPYNAAFAASMDRVKQAHLCKVCGDWAGAGRVDGLCAACTRIADQEAARADHGRRDRVLRHLAQLAANGQQWRGHNISSLAD